MTDISESAERGGGSAAVPRQGRLLGLDYGTKRLGIAVSDPDQKIAGAVENYNRQNPQVDAKHLRKVAEEYEAVGLVVGLPVHMSGDEGGKAREAREFGNWISEATGLPVCWWDERYSSAIAEMYLLQGDLSKKKRKARLDKLAAQIMLQSFLDADDRSRKPESFR